MKAVSAALDLLGADGRDYRLRVPALLRTGIIRQALPGPEPDEQFTTGVNTLRPRAHAGAVLATRPATCGQTGQSFVALISQAMTLPPVRGP